jgi:RNA polymerase sigma factor (sigma-70 family)
MRMEQDCIGTGDNREHMDAHKSLLDARDAIRRAVAFVCRKHGLHGADAEDFASTVNVKLLEDECAILRQFRGDSNLNTYLNVVVHRIFIDQCVHEHGKWRPSADAKRIGPVAAELERRVQWDGEQVDDAVRQTAAAHPDVPLAEIKQIAANVPQRQRRRSTVPLDEAVELFLTAREQSDILIVTRARRSTRSRAEEIVRTHLKSLEPQDRLILQFQFEDDMHISDIARRLQVDQKPLYRRREQLFRELRSALQEQGIGADEIRDLLEHPDDE